MARRKIPVTSGSTPIELMIVVATVAHETGLHAMTAQPSGGATQFCNGASSRQFDSRR